MLVASRAAASRAIHSSTPCTVPIDVSAALTAPGSVPGSRATKVRDGPAADVPGGRETRREQQGRPAADPGGHGGDDGQRAQVGAACPHADGVADRAAVPTGAAGDAPPDQPVE